MKRLLLFIPLCLILAVFSTTALYGHSGVSDKEHLHTEDPHKYHFGFATVASHIIGESGIAPGFHVHFVRQMGKANRWGLGLGYETVADEHWHNSLNLLANYRPVSFLSILAGPGLSLKKHEGDFEALPAFHTEAVFEFNLKGLHAGPLLGYGFDKEESHFSIGFHVGFGF
jgi:hypothetical protein